MDGDRQRELACILSKGFIEPTTVQSGIFRPEMLEPMGLPKGVRVLGWGMGLERPTMIKSAAYFTTDVDRANRDVDTRSRILEHWLDTRPTWHKSRRERRSGWRRATTDQSTLGRAMRAK